MTRALGDYDPDRREKLRGISATPVVTTHTLDDDDEFLLLACDGLWDVFSAQSAVDFARRMLVQEQKPAVVCEGLVAEALKRGSTDNVSVLLVRLGILSAPLCAALDLGLRFPAVGDVAASALERFGREAPELIGAELAAVHRRGDNLRKGQCPVASEALTVTRSRSGL